MTTTGARLPSERVDTQESSDYASKLGTTSLLTLLSIGATLIYLAFGISYVVPRWNDPEFWKPEVLGSFLQGISSPIAFFWLVVGYFLQRKDLELQRYELRENNRTQSEQQAAMAQQATLIAKQFELAEMRSHWDLDIAIVATSMETDPGGSGLRIAMMNEGASAYGVNFTLRNVTNGAAAQPFFVAHLGKNGRAEILVTPNLNSQAFPYLDVSFLRADGVHRCSSYLVDPFGKILQPAGTRSL